MSQALVPTTLPLPSRVDALPPLTSALDAVPHEARFQWIARLGSRELTALFARAAGGPPLAPADLARADGSPRVAHGKNQLPLFARFQKRFAQVGDEIVGYNHNPGWVMWFTGAGHFVARPSPDVEGEVWLDYTRLPQATHPEFPALERQSGLLFPFVYGDMIDVVRRVSEHVVIGHSFKPSGRWGTNDDQYFVLTLE